MISFLEILVSFYLFLAIVFVLFAADDLFVDFWAFIKNLKIRPLPQRKWNKLCTFPEARLAIIIAGWKEYDVLRPMVEGNLGHINYHNFKIILGVYPNDLETLNVAKELAKEFDHVEVVVNHKNGPTSKGQMINYMVNELLSHPSTYGGLFDGFVIHDAEDIIHPDSLRLYSWKLEEFDFIQIPIFSLEVPILNLVAGTYVDEFAECHSKDLLVRESLKCPIPSAGVGTAISRKLVQKALQEQNGDLLIPHCVTEDYILGLSTKKWGFKSTFANYYILDDNSKKEFIATREYFPKRFWPSVRQRSRWVLGIAFQGWQILGWKQDLAENYFLFRDRKAPVTNLINVLGLLVFTLFFIATTLDPESVLEAARNVSARLGNYSGLVYALPIINIVLLGHRMIQRMRFVNNIYGFRLALLAPFRIIVGNVIGFLASYKAAVQFRQSVKTGAAPKWVKTDHENPFQKTAPNKTLTSKSSSIASAAQALSRPNGFTEANASNDFVPSQTSSQNAFSENTNSKNQTL